ncbi:PEP-CTERM sorting domain-containing protein [bacterium]|nr:PEP-CTERM sorting domain-containing protein [bacterium]
MSRRSMAWMIGMLLVVAMTGAQAAVVLTGGITIAEQGGYMTPANLAAASGGALPFAVDDMSASYPAHATPHLNDEIYGNDNSWIGRTVSPTLGSGFVGVSFGGLNQVAEVAFGRANIGGNTDRALGLYTLQYTTVANPDETTPDAAWTTIGTLDYQSAGGTHFTAPAQRHRYTFAPLYATGIRLVVPYVFTQSAGLATCIDELEAYSHNIAPLGTPFASSTHSSGSYPLAGVFDGQQGPGAGPYWNDGTQSVFPDWVGVHFDRAYSISGVDARTLVTASLDLAARTIDDVYIQYLIPGGDWTNQADWMMATVAFTLIAPTTNDGTQNHYVDLGGIWASGIRVYYGPNSGNRDGWNYLDELQVYGTVPEPATLSLLGLGGLALLRRRRRSGKAKVMSRRKISGPGPIAMALVGALVFASGAQAALVLSSGLALVEQNGTFAASNLSAGQTPYALDSYPHPSHTIPHLNDLIYGNSNSWLGNGGTVEGSAFAGISFGATAIAVQSIAFGRDNLGAFTDRMLGVYTLQYTQVANPHTNLTGLLTTGDPTTGYVDIGTLDYQSAGGANFTAPALCHRYEFGSISATAVRLKVPDTGICIDEIELYNGTLSQPLGGNMVVIQDETTHATGLPNAGGAIPAEPAPGDGSYDYTLPGQSAWWTPGLVGQAKVEVSWGVSFNHSQDVDYFFDPDGAGPLPEVLLAQGVDQTLLNDQVTVPGVLAWSGFYPIAGNLDLQAGSTFRIIGAAVGVDPFAVSSAVWQFTAVPEPATMSLLALGALGLLRRRRRRQV